jgi:hypothetical protein
MAARTPRLEALQFEAAPLSKSLQKSVAKTVSRSLLPQEGGDIMGTVLKFAFYASVLALVVFCLLLFIHYTYTPIFTFTTSEGVIEVPPTQDAQVQFSDAVATVDISMNFVNPLSCSYTLMFDVLLLGDFKPTTAPRVLTYRSLEAVKLDNSMQNFKPESDLLRLYPETNFIVWVDPIKNDLYAGVVTQQAGMAPVLHISEAITNVPLRTPFRMAFVFDADFLEIYMNGRLSSTLTWKGTVKESLKPFFTPTSIVDQSIFMANTYYWSRTLRPSEVMSAGTVQNPKILTKLTA